MPFVSGASLPGRVLASKRPAWMSSLPDNAQFLRGAAAAKCALRSGFAFPILVGDEVATVVEFFSERDEQPAPQIVELMTNVGIQLGRVIERERHADLVRALSLTDELTGLHNRRGFLALAGQQLRGSLRSKKSHTVLFADLDGLKRINDSLGHEAGDEAIATFAQVLRRTFREGDIVARLGGDEFIVLLEGQLSSAQAALVRLTASLVALNEERPGPRTLAASVGVVEVPLDGSEPLEAIVARADAAMYQVKRARRATRDR
jgi:diguanylate cyclase (GGDEF)-like protein